MSTAGLVLAAGEGRRFGGPKQLAEVDGVPILERVLGAMEAVPELGPRVVVLGARSEAIGSGVRLGSFAVVVAEDWAEGQAASLRAGVAALPGAEEVLVCLGDTPFVTPEVIAGILGADPGGGADAVRATYDGEPGHPVLLRRRVLDRVGGLRGDVGARDLFEGLAVLAWEAGHLADPTDIDTREQLKEITR